MTASNYLNALSRLTTGRPLLGFVNFARKDVREWLLTRRASGTLAVTTALTSVATASSWIAYQRGNPARSLDPTDNFLAAGWLQLVPVMAVFATMALVIGERDRGTLGWSLSKPLSRGAFLASKLVTGVGVFGLVGIAIPMGVSLAVATLAYGGAPDLGLAAWAFVGSLALVALYVTLNVTVSTFVNSQAVVATVAIMTLLGSQILGGLLPELAAFLPMSIGNWVVAAAGGHPVEAATPISYVAWIVLLVAMARLRFECGEL